MADKKHQAWRIAHSESSLGWGGQEHRVLAELRGFQERGCAVWLLAPRNSQIYRRAVEAKIPARHLVTSKPLFPFNAMFLAAWLARHRVQILNPHSSQDGWLLGVAGRLAFTPFVVRTRHIDVSYPNRRLSRHAFTTLCDHVLTTSDKISGHFREFFGLPEDRVSTIPTGIDLALFTPEGPKAQLLPPRPGVPTVGMVSVLRSWKGHETLLEAAQILRTAGFEARFAIVGDGPGRNELPRLIQARNLGDIVTMAGHHEDVPSVLRALDILVIPSTKHEGVPQIGLQALATKTAVIGSDVGGIPEIIQPGKTGRIFPAKNAIALAEAIRETLGSPAVTRQMAENGRRTVEANHGLESMLDKLDQLYRRRFRV